MTVREKVGHPPPGEVLPRDVEGVPGDARQASPAKRLEIDDPQAYSKQLRLTPDTGSVRHFPDERTLTGRRPAATASAYAELAALPKPSLPYTAPEGVGLRPIEAHATIHLSAGPDSGWPTLAQFLSGTTSALTVGLYDCTSHHVVAALKKAVSGKRFALVLDQPGTNPTADQTDASTVADRSRSPGQDFVQAWALTRMDRLASAWIYPTAYHIKVAVRDGTTHRAPRSPRRRASTSAPCPSTCSTGGLRGSSNR